jgi:DNA-binding GntR family transcriptional regulator
MARGKTEDDVGFGVGAGSGAGAASVPGDRAASAPPVAAVGVAPRLHERVERILAAEIAAGAIPPAARLLESHLARRFGISRVPVRRALAALVAAGLLRRDDGPGYRVAAADPAASDEASPSGPPGDTAVRPPPAVRPLPALPLPGPPTAPPRLSAMSPLAAPVSWELIYAEIEAAIVRHTAFASWRVVETELARAYGVSRTVARDVVARLNQRGILRKDGKGRWIAAGLTPAHVGDLYELRWVVEPAALVNAAPRMPPAVVHAARAHVEAALAAADRLDGAALDALEAELHVDLLAYCGNRLMIEGLRHHQSLLIAHSFLYERMPRLYPVEPFLPEHLEVLAALEAGRVAAAAAALERHLRASLDRAVDRIRAVTAVFRPPPLPYLQPVRPDGAD